MQAGRERGKRRGEGTAWGVRGGGGGGGGARGHDLWMNQGTLVVTLRGRVYHGVCYKQTVRPELITGMFRSLVV